MAYSPWRPAAQNEQKNLQVTPVSRLPPRLPPLPTSQFDSLTHEYAESPISPLYDSTTPLYQADTRSANNSTEYFERDKRMSRQQAPRASRQWSETIPLADNAQPIAGVKQEASETISPVNPSPSDERPRRRRTKEKQKKPFISWETTWIVYFLSLVQATVFIVELVKNALFTGIPIQTSPQINPMIGPSYYVLINMGGRYVPCMKDISNLGLPKDLKWPCPWSTTNNSSDPSMQCTLEQLCGFPPLSDPPNQWYRFIVPIFLHAGIIHIGFNLLLQLTLGRDMEKKIGHVRFLLVYLASGIFGFVLGGNFAANGIVSLGASGSLFGIIALNLLDLLYTWKEKRSPWKELAFIIVDIAISFVLGLLPGLDNFSHIGGFLMGLVLGICILHSPNVLRETTMDSAMAPPANSKRSKRRKPIFKTFAKDPLGFFKGRKPLWWAWWLIRVGALIAVFICFILLINNFYKNSNTCSWCKYLSCLPVNNWCDVGNLQQQVKEVPATSSNRRDLLSLLSGEADIL